MPDLHFDRYYRYDELTAVLKAFADEHPDLVKLETLGQSYEGRDVHLVTVTNFHTGPAEDKPALWIDGNIHASEVSPSTACLYLIDTLVKTYGEREDVTRALDSRAFYIVPRVNPDGAELALADAPKIIRSSTRPYPYDETPVDGLHQEDIDGDGRLLSMRVRDANGPWKVSEKEPRLLVRRDPTETGGVYYRVLPEGLLDDYDGVTLTVQAKKEGLDLNRNFPANWRGQAEQAGAGPYPVSEPEVKNLVDFVAKHPNITGGITFHTYGGVLLRPLSGQSDEEFAAEDLWTYQKIGAKGTELTGYPHASVFHDFKYHPKEIITGAFDDWLVEGLGVFAWTVEIWSPQRQAGITDYKFIDWYREHDFEDDLKLLKWSDDVLEGKGYVDWYTFQHPQLGEVELGGWDALHAWRNPPPQFLEREVAKFPDWCLWHLLISPKLEPHSHEIEALGDDTYRVQIVVHNTGWLPSYVTKHAQEKKLVRGVVAEVGLPEGASLKVGKVREVHGQLSGRAYKSVVPSPVTADPTTERLKLEWVVHAPAGGTLHVTVKHERAGVVRQAVTLK